MRDASLQQWSEASAAQQDALCTSLLEFVVSRAAQLKPFVRKQVLQAVAALHKRGWASRSQQRKVAGAGAARTYARGGVYWGREGMQGRRTASPCQVLATHVWPLVLPARLR